jgi:hypothetical protein
VRVALDAYAQADQVCLADGEQLNAFAAYAMREIDQVLEGR